MNNFMRRQQNDWSDISDALIDSEDKSNDSTETACVFQIGDLVAKGKTFKNNSQQKTSHFRNTNGSRDEKSVAHNAHNSNYKFTIPHLPTFRNGTVPKVRDCTNPSDSDVSMVICRQPQAMYRTIPTGHTSTPMKDTGQRINMVAREKTNQRMDETSIGMVGRINNSNFSCKDKEEITHLLSFNSTESLRQEVHRRQLAGPTKNDITLEKVSYNDISKLIYAVKNNTISPHKKKILIEALETSSKKTFNGNDLSRRTLQERKSRQSSTVRSGYSPSSSDISSGNDCTHSSRSRKKSFKRCNTSKSLQFSNVYYNSPPTQIEVNNLDSLPSVGSYPVINGLIEKKHPYRHTMQPVQTKAYNSSRNGSVINTSKLQRHQETQPKDHTRGYSMMSEYSNLSMQPSLIKRKLFSQSKLWSESSAVNNTDSPMRRVAVHNVYKARDDKEPRKRKRSMNRRSMAQRNMSQHDLASSVKPGSLTPLLCKLASIECTTNPVLINNRAEMDLLRSNTRENVLPQHYSSGKSHKRKSRMLFTSGPDSETEDENSCEEEGVKTNEISSKPDQVEKNLKLKKCYVALERLPIEVLKSIITQSKNKQKTGKFINNLDSYEEDFELPKNPLPNEGQKKNVAFSENADISVDDTKNTSSSQEPSVAPKKRKHVRRQDKQTIPAAGHPGSQKEPLPSKRHKENVAYSEGVNNSVDDTINTKLSQEPSDAPQKRKSVRRKDKQVVPTAGHPGSQKEPTSSKRHKENEFSERVNNSVKDTINTNPSQEPSDAPQKKKSVRYKDKQVIPTEIRRSSRIRLPPLNYWLTESALFHQGRLYPWQKNYSNPSQSTSTASNKKSNKKTQKKKMICEDENDLKNNVSEVQEIIDPKTLEIGNHEGKSQSNGREPIAHSQNYPPMKMMNEQKKDFIELASHSETLNKKNNVLSNKSNNVPNNIENSNKQKNNNINNLDVEDIFVNASKDVSNSTKRVHGKKITDKRSRNVRNPIQTQPNILKSPNELIIKENSVVGNNENSNKQKNNNSNNLDVEDSFVNASKDVSNSIKRVHGKKITDKRSRNVRNPIQTQPNILKSPNKLIIKENSVVRNNENSNKQKNNNSNNLHVDDIFVNASKDGSNSTKRVHSKKITDKRSRNVRNPIRTQPNILKSPNELIIKENSVVRNDENSYKEKINNSNNLNVISLDIFTNDGKDVSSSSKRVCSIKTNDNRSKNVTNPIQTQPNIFQSPNKLNNKENSVVQNNENSYKEKINNSNNLNVISLDIFTNDGKDVSSSSKRVRRMKTNDNRSKDVTNPIETQQNILKLPNNRNNSKKSVVLNNENSNNNEINNRNNLYNISKDILVNDRKDVSTSEKRVRNMKTNDNWSKKVTNTIQKQQNIFKSPNKLYETANSVISNSDDEECWSVSYCSTKSRKQSKFLHFF